MDNVHLKSLEYDDDDSIAWFLLEGGIVQFLEQTNFNSFNESLWQLLVAITSDKDISKGKKKSLLRTLKQIKMMINGCNYFLHHKKRWNYEENWRDRTWCKNPYRCLKGYRTEEDEKLNHYLASFKEPLSMLTRKESQDFILAFKNFFTEMDVTSWVNLLDDWEYCLINNKSLFICTDYAPLKTYEKLRKLNEACVICFEQTTMRSLPPNHHLIVDYLSWSYADDYYDYANPFEIINDVFHEKGHEDVRKYILDLFPIGSKERNLSAKELYNIRYTLTSLLISGWLLLQTDYYPEKWLDPNEINYFHCPIPESFNYWFSESLQDKESQNLRKTLSKLYFEINVREQMYLLGSKTIDYLSKEPFNKMTEEDLESRRNLLKILDVLTLITLEQKKGLTKDSHITYPPSSLRKMKNKGESL